jgi:LmbE family N-acetylglucosaminyl deacetylase
MLVLLAAAGASLAADRTILAIGAHAGDMEITTGAVLARHTRAGDRVVILHLTLGEGGNLKMSRDTYAEQKRREAVAAAKALGAEVIFGPYKDAMIPRSDEPVRYVADVIAKVKPSYVFTHWKNSIHRDHTLTHTIVEDAVLLASVEGTRGLRGVYYAENWEDADDFHPYIYMDAAGGFDEWKKAVTQYEFIRGGISSFPYLDYYEALARVRGAQAGKKLAIAFEVGSLGKKRVLDGLP